MKYLTRTQLVLISVFIVINVSLFINSSDSTPYPNGPILNATYHNAADGQRYWGVALNLVEQSKFSIPQLWDSRPDTPIARSGPLSPLIFALFIKLVSFDNAPLLIVFFQCGLLYVMSLLGRRLAVPFSSHPTLVQILILFNPNLIGLAHHAQSDIVYAFIFTVILYLINKLLIAPHNVSRTSFLLIGGLTGLLCLTRHIGLVFSIVLPIALATSLCFHTDRKTLPIKTIIIGACAATLAFLIVIFPWSARNYFTFQMFSPVTHQSSQLEYNLRRLVSYNPSVSNIELYIRDLINSELVTNGQSICINEIHRTRSCSKAIDRAYVHGILIQPWSSILEATISASIRTLFTGGSTRIVNYLGIDNEEPYLHILRPFDSQTIDDVLSSVAKSGKAYLLVISLTIGFTIALRLFGFLGLYKSLTVRHLLPINIFYLLTIGSYLVAFFVVSTSRFRAPLEPILMLYAAVGLTNFVDFIKEAISTRTR